MQFLMMQDLETSAPEDKGGMSLNKLHSFRLRSSLNDHKSIILFMVVYVVLTLNGCS
jgi:hypothetical protein